MILDQIVAHKRQEVTARKRRVPLEALRARAAAQAPPLDLAAALRQPGVGLIAEVKRASPSRGLLCPDFDPVGLAGTYAAGGAAAISVLTERRFFQGRLESLENIRRALPNTPLLRKDFILEAYQVYESRAHGADALLLIAAILDDGALGELLALATELGMAALVEVHDKVELERAQRCRPRLVGINNRSLGDFSVDLGNFGRLRRHLPKDVLTVAESGIHSAADVRRLAESRADAILVGEALVTTADVGAKVRELVQAGRLAVSG